MRNARRAIVLLFCGLLLGAGQAAAWGPKNNGTPSNSSISSSSINGVLNPQAPPFAVVADGKWCQSDGSISAVTSTTTLTCATTAPFTSSDVGKSIVVYGAGAAGADLITTIAGYTSSSTVTLSAAASTTVTTAVVAYGTDATSGLQTFLTTFNFTGPIDAQNFPSTTAASQQVYRIPPGTYVIAGNSLVSTIASHIKIACDGANLVLLGTGPYFTWGDGTHFTIDHQIEGCTFYGTTAENSQLVKANKSDKDTFSNNRVYNFRNAAVLDLLANGDGHFVIEHNQMQSINDGVLLRAVDDATNIWGNVFGNYYDRAVVAGVGATDALNSLSIIGNKCNGSTTSVSCFDLGGVQGAIVAANYYEANTGTPSGDFVRLGYNNHSGTDTRGVTIVSNQAVGHNASISGLVEQISNGVSNPSVIDLTVRDNVFQTAPSAVYQTSGNVRLWNIGPNMAVNISGTEYNGVGTGTTAGNMVAQDSASSYPDTQYNFPVVFANGFRLGKNPQTAGSTYGTSNHDVIIPVADGAGGSTVNLQAAGGTGLFYLINKDDSAAGATTIAPNGTDTINGVNAAITLTNQYDWVLLMDRITGGWQIVAGTIYSGVGACTNQVVTGLTTHSAPTCSSLTKAMAGSNFYRQFYPGGSASNTLSTSNAGTTSFAAGVGTTSGTEPNDTLYMGVGGAFKGLWCRVTTAPGASNSYTIKIMRSAAGGGFASMLTTGCVISGTTPTCTDISDTGTFAADDQWDYQATTTVGGTTPSATTIRCTTEVDT